MKLLWQILAEAVGALVFGVLVLGTMVLVAFFVGTLYVIYAVLSP